MLVFEVFDVNVDLVGEVREKKLHDDLIPLLIQELGVVGPIWPQWVLDSEYSGMRFYHHGGPDPFYMYLFDKNTGDREPVAGVTLAKINWQLEKNNIWAEMF